MAYQKLLVNAGGGIISTKQQSEQAKGTASILIGLGGTGIDCLRTIKTQVYNRLIPDDAEALIREYSHIRFIGVDTDENSTGKKTATKNSTKESVDARMQLDEVTEFFPIINPKVGEAVKKKEALDMRREMSWYNQETPPPKVGAAGAGAIRQIGRFMMMDRADSFMNTIREAIRSAKIGLTGPSDGVGPQVNVHIFAGISGGTGSGSFLDVCYMVREVTKNENVKVFGYFFLPDVNLSRIDLDEGKITSDMIKRNGYAAMQELDFCMNLPDNGGSFVQTYKGNIQIPWDNKPVDMCHLVCASDEAGHSIANPYEYAMNVTAEYVMDFLTAPVSEAFSLASHQANFVGQVAMADSQKKLGVNLGYCVIGAASASLPLREINTYLASELFGKFSGIGKAIPTEQDVKRLAIGALGRGINSDSELYDSLLQEIEDDTGVHDFSYYPEPYTLVLQEGDGASFTHHYSDQKSDKSGLIQKNAKSMMDENNVASLVGRVRNYMAKVMRDIDRGPIFAYRMLSASESHNLGNIIDGLIETNDRRLSQAEYERTTDRAAYETARNDFLSRNKRSLLDNDKKRFADYENATRNEVESQMAVEIYTQLGTVLNKLQEQVKMAAAGYYAKLGRVMTQLLETFQLNRDDLAAGVTTKTDTFSVPLLEIKDIKGTLDDEIKRLDVGNMMAAFMDLLITNESAWIEEDENRIARLVTDFFIKTAFQGYADRSITLFLQDKYREDLGSNPGNVELLANLVYRDWIGPLTQKASPLFVNNLNIRAVEGSSGLSYISMPQDSAPITMAAQKMNQANGKWALKASALTDRIFVMCSRYVLPLASYAKQEEFGNVYYNARSNGVHLYEGGQVPGMTFNDWNYLAPIMPNYFIHLDEAKDMVKKIVGPARDLYQKARELGVIDEDNWICAPSEETISDLQRLIEEARTAAASIVTIQDASGKRPLLEQLAGANQIELSRITQMQRDGEDSQKVRSRVALDHFVASPNYQIQVSQIVEKAEKVIAAGQEAYKALKDKIDDTTNDVVSLNSYCDALFTGVISIDGATVSYVKGGLMKKVEKLCEYGAAYPFSSIPVYQGFVSFKAMSQGDKDNIAKTAAERINGKSGEIQTALENLRTTVLNENKIASYQNMADTLAERDQIIAFLEQLIQRFESFAF